MEVEAPGIIEVGEGLEAGAEVPHHPGERIPGSGGVQQAQAAAEAMAPSSGRVHSGPRHDWPPSGPSHATPPWSATWGLPGTWTHTAARMCSAPRNATAPARPNRSPKPEAHPRKVQS